VVVLELPVPLVKFPEPPTNKFSVIPTPPVTFKAPVVVLVLPVPLVKFPIPAKFPVPPTNKF
jgi:hypothetical protein